MFMTKPKPRGEDSWLRFCSPACLRVLTGLFSAAVIKAAECAELHLSTRQLRTPTSWPDAICKTPIDTPLSPSPILPRNPPFPRGPTIDDEPAKLRPLSSTSSPRPAARLLRPPTTVTPSSGTVAAPAGQLRQRLPAAAATAASASAAGWGVGEPLRPVWTVHERSDGAGGGTVWAVGIQARAGVP